MATEGPKNATTGISIANISAAARRINKFDPFKNKNDVYIGRQNSFSPVAKTCSKWHNPFTLKSCNDDRDLCLSKYKEYVLSRQDLMSALPELYGKRLGCWCYPLPCHGNVLADLALAQQSKNIISTAAPQEKI